jgi:quercetin dioxygenase-like cupin family protein
MRIHFRSAAAVLTALATSAVLSQMQQAFPASERFPQFENPQAKVWKTIIQPHQPLAMHHHDHPRVIVALTGGTVNIVDPEGHIEPHVWETGKAYWLPANPPNTLHSDVNGGEKPIEVMVVELEKEW